MVDRGHDDEYNHILNNEMDNIGSAVGIEICDDGDDKD